MATDTMEADRGLGYARLDRSAAAANSIESTTGSVTRLAACCQIRALIPSASTNMRLPRRAMAMALRRAAALATAVLCLGLASQHVRAQQDCAVHWEVTARTERPPARLSVQMSFDTGARSATHLRLQGGWQAASAEPGQAAVLAEVADQPQLRQLRHTPGQRVQLRWEFTPQLAAPAGGALLTERWFAFTAGTVLPWPEELGREPPNPWLCVSLRAVGNDVRWLSSFGRADGAQAHWRVNINSAQWPRALFAGGAWQTRETTVAGLPLTLAMPEGAAFGFGIDTLAKSAAATLARLREPWGSPEAAPMLLLMLPGAAAPAGLALHQALVVQAPPGLPMPSPGFDAVLAAQWARGWLSDRLGPLAHQGRGDAVLRAWFSEGLADFLAHRWLLREGRWTPSDYADALNRKINRYQALPELDASNLRLATGAAGDNALAVLPAARGEFLALAWHQALQRAGHPGLEPVLFSLLVPAARAQPEGPTSAPLANQRLLAALRRPLGDMPLKAMVQHIDEGRPFSFDAQSLGPCFQRQSQDLAMPYRPVDQAMARDDCRTWLMAAGSSTAEAAQRQAVAGMAEPVDARAVPAPPAARPAGGPPARLANAAAARPTQAAQAQGNDRRTASNRAARTSGPATPPTAKPTKAAKATKAANRKPAADAAKPAKPGKPATSATPTTSTTSTTSARPAKPSKPAKPAASRATTPTAPPRNAKPSTRTQPARPARQADPQAAAR
jgi:hypothetical protein